MNHPDGDKFILHGVKTYIVSDTYEYLEGYQVHHERYKYWDGNDESGIIIAE